MLTNKELITKFDIRQIEERLKTLTLTLFGLVVEARIFLYEASGLIVNDECGSEVR